MAVIGPEAPSLEAKLAAFNSVPLFMQQLPEGETDDAALSALQALIHDGTPDEVAKGFKENGNDYFKGKRYREALGFYTQGIDAKPTQPDVIQSLLLNRAACNLELKNFGSVLRDCSRILTENSQSEKAYYRSAAALVALERYEEAIDCCDRCLSFSPDNDGVKTLRNKAIQADDAKKLKIKQTEERERQAKMQKMQLAFALKERNILKISDVPDGTPYSAHFDESGSLVLPVWFLYPQHNVSDLIQEFSEDTAFGDHLDAMFAPDAPPPPFDPSGAQYRSANLMVYATTRGKRAFKCGRKTTLREVLASAKAKEGEKPDGIDMKDGCLKFIVVPKGEEEKKWIDEFKRTRGW